MLSSTADPVEALRPRLGLCSPLCTPQRRVSTGELAISQPHSCFLPLSWLSRPWACWAALGAGRAEGGVVAEHSQVAGLSWTTWGTPAHFGVAGGHVGACVDSPRSWGCVGPLPQPTEQHRLFWGHTSTVLGTLLAQLGPLLCCTANVEIPLSFLTIIWGDGLWCDFSGFTSFLPASGPHSPSHPQGSHSLTPRSATRSPPGRPLDVRAEFLGPELLSPSCDVTGPHTLPERWVSGLACDNIPLSPSLLLLFARLRG